jgi:uroporphyrin-III C-methyltransferase/precorrin-2 dehydrogenase/sirohydrochlorin ferrochelatase
MAGRHQPVAVDLAKQGKRVSAKGGDPFVFGRGGENRKLAEHGIRRSGAGISAATDARRMPDTLTHRDYAQILSFTTGHAKNEDSPTTPMDWSMLARPGQTAVFYMGLAGLPRILQQLQAHGMPPERAAAVIEQGTRPGQRVILGTVATLAQQVEQAQVKSPLLIVGEVTRLQNSCAGSSTGSKRRDVSEMKSGNCRGEAPRPEAGTNVPLTDEIVGMSDC